MYIGADGNCHGSTDVKEAAIKWQGKFTRVQDLCHPVFY